LNALRENISMRVESVKIITAGGRKVLLPLEEEGIREYVEGQWGYVDFIANQISDKQFYAFAFKGRRNLVFLDLGANIGLVSIYASDVCDRIVAVEPAPATFALLRRVSKHFPNIEAYNMAICGVDGVCVFHVNDINTTANSVVNDFGVPTDVRGVTLPALVKETKLDHVDFCKMDIEGSELDALPMETIAALKGTIDCYFIETHNCPMSTWQCKIGALVESFLTVGYRIASINDMGFVAELPKQQK